MLVKRAVVDVLLLVFDAGPNVEDLASALVLQRGRLYEMDSSIVVS